MYTRVPADARAVGGGAWPPPVEIRLPDGGTVVDVGANIGLFSLWAARRVGATGRVLSVEPAPDARAALRDNLARLDGGARCLVCGVAAVRSDRASTTTMTVYGAAAGWGTTLPDARSTGAAAAAFVDNALETGEAEGALGPPALVALARWLRRRGPLDVVYQALVDAGVRRALASAREVEVPAASLSTILARDERLQENPERATPIDLLKIDVEAGEMEVLAGLSDADWGRVQAVAIEAHSVGAGGHAAAAWALRARGFSVWEGRDPLLEGTGLKMVWGLRKGAGKEVAEIF